MRGERDLQKLLRQMRPVLSPEPHGIVTTPLAPPEGLTTFAVIAEDEGTTLVARLTDLRHAGFACPEVWARISLTVHSDLAAVGLTAAISAALAAQGISANVVAGYFHDHIFVSWDHREAAIAALSALAESPGQ